MAEKPALLCGYEEFLRDVKARVQSAQVRAALAVNSELVLLYWQIGAEISRRMQANSWGAKVVDQLAADLARVPGHAGLLTSKSALYALLRRSLDR